MAAERAVLAGIGVLRDPFAQRMLTPSMAAIACGAQRVPHRLRARWVTLAGLAARVLWFDAQVVAALDAGIAQVAVIGAGYDSRAWRLRRDGVQFFELDQGTTQRDKVRRALGPGPTYVEADLTTEGAAGPLREHGLDPSRPALFIVEGVTMYLRKEVVRHQLGELGSAGAAGSRLAVDFQPPRTAGTTRNRRQLLLQRLARVGSGEGFRLAIDRADALELVEASGWVVHELTGAREAAHALVPADCGLPLDAVNDRKTLLSALCA